MKFQDSSFNGLKVTVGTKSVTHPRTHAPTNGRSKSNMPHQVGGIIKPAKMSARAYIEKLRPQTEN